MNQNLYTVWCPDHGETSPEEGKVLYAFDAGEAAEEWAKWTDWTSAEYMIAKGEGTDVVVQDHTGRRHQFTVSGEQTVVYTARLLRSPADVDEVSA